MNNSNLNNLKPSHFIYFPNQSILKKWEAENIARNINVIRKRLGDEWPLTVEQYIEERKKHDAENKSSSFSTAEIGYFKKVYPMIINAKGCMEFSSEWAESAQTTLSNKEKEISGK